MEAITRTLQIVAIIAVLGASVETFVPGLITEKVKQDLSALSLGMIGILLSFLLLMFILKIRIREGFEDKLYENRWKVLMDSNRVKEVCTFYTDIYEKTLVVEKGAPPAEVKTDAQAREAVDARFAKVMTLKPISCTLVDDLLNKVGSLDNFFVAIQSAPDTFLAQNLDTALACRTLLIDNYLKVKDAQNKTKEGFEDKPLCSESVATERREYLSRKNLSDEAQKCIIVEEIPPEKKLSYVNMKIDTMESELEKFKAGKANQDSIAKILEDCTYYKTELEKMKKEAEEMSNKYNLK